MRNAGKWAKVGQEAARAADRDPKGPGREVRAAR